MTHEALASTLGFLGLSKSVKAEENPKVMNDFVIHDEVNEAIMNEFRDLILIDENGLTPVPIIWGNDKEVASQVLRPNQVYLPLINIHRHFTDGFDTYYGMTVRTLYEDDMDQILEQVYSKFNPKLKNKSGEYTLVSMANNMAADDNSKLRVNKYNFLISHYKY